MALKLLIAFLLLALAGCAGTQWKATHEVAEANRDYPPSGNFVDVNGHPVHYVMKGSGPDLVLIHGASGNLRDWTFDAVDRLARDYRVIAFDRPGLGHTPRIDNDGASIFEQAALLQGAAARLGVRKPIVLGQSYGGAVALAWAVNHPDDLSALVLLAAASQPWEGGLSTFYQVTSGPLGPLANPLISAWVSDDYVREAIGGIFAPQPVPEGYVDHIGAALTLRPSSLRENALQRASLKAEITAMQPRYPDIDVPVELIHGDADTTVGLNIHSVPTARQIPGANLVTLEGIGHMPQHVAIKQMDAAIARAARRAGLR